MDDSSPPQPQSRGFSSTVNIRPVAPTSRKIVEVSSGTKERTSTTVQSMPPAASSCAASSALGTMAPSATNVASLPVRSTLAEPNVSTISPSGTSIFDE